MLNGINYVAESLGLPLVSPYFEEKNVKRRDFGEGVNFAVAGATALKDSFFWERGIRINPLTNVSLAIEMDWFKEMLASHCQKSSGKSTCHYLPLNCLKVYVSCYATGEKSFVPFEEELFRSLLSSFHRNNFIINSFIKGTPKVLFFFFFAKKYFP